MPRRLLALVTAALLLVLPTAAYAGTTIGTTPTPSDVSCNFPFDMFQVSRPGVASTAVQGQGVLTSWSFRAGSQPASVSLRVFRPTADPDTFTVAADSGSQSVAAGTGLHTFPTRILVQTGDHIGLHYDTTTPGACLATGRSTEYGVRYSAASTAVGSPAATTLDSGAEVDISAVLEPDRDQDGYGDETQDQCPVYGSAPCPTPDTVITRTPRKRSPVSKLTFTATGAASGYVCRLDAKSAGCTSPVTYRCLKPGKHRFSVYAIGTHGDPDTTPAAVTFKVAKKRHGCGGHRPLAARSGTAPVTAPDAVTAYAGSYHDVKVLANDTDPDGDALTVCGLAPAAQHHIRLDAENPKKVAVIPGGRTEPGTYVFTYYACDATSQTPGTLTVTVPAPPKVTVKPVPGRPGKVRARTDADFRIRLTYGSPGEDQDGLVFIPKHGSVTFGTRYHRLNWTARLTDGTLLFRGVVSGIY